MKKTCCFLGILLVYLVPNAFWKMGLFFLSAVERFCFTLRHPSSDLDMGFLLTSCFLDVHKFCTLLLCYWKGTERQSRNSFQITGKNYWQKMLVRSGGLNSPFFALFPPPQDPDAKQPEVAGGQEAEERARRVSEKKKCNFPFSHFPP